jgi:glutamyl/glutaminyl-tRNA synthetase
MPFLQEVFPNAASEPKLTELVAKIQPDMVTLHDAVEMLSFYFTRLEPAADILEHHQAARCMPIIQECLNAYAQTELNSDAFLECVKAQSKAANIQLKDMFAVLRLLLTGQPQGLAVKDIVAMLGSDEAKKRLNV